MQMYRSAIVNELGHIMFWCDELQGDEQIECILNSHPEWSVKCVEMQKVRYKNMIVKAIWEFDVDDSEMDGKCVDIKGLCEDLTQRKVDYLLKHNELNAEDFQYECHPELPSDWDEKK